MYRLLEKSSISDTLTIGVIRQIIEHDMTCTKNLEFEFEVRVKDESMR